MKNVFYRFQKYLTLVKEEVEVVNISSSQPLEKKKTCLFPPTRAVCWHQILHHRLHLQELSEAEGQVRHALHRVEQPAH